MTFIRRTAPSAALVLALATLAGPTVAQTPPASPPPAPPPQIGGGLFRLDAPADLPSGPQLAKRGAPLAVFEVRSPAAARLEAGVDAKADNWLGASLRRPLGAGQVLLAAPSPRGPPRKGVFCAPVKEGAWYSVGPCLLDADGDGRFEAALTAAFDSGQSDGLMVTDKRNLLGVLYGAPKPLAAPVPYAPADYGAGPAARVRLTWTARRDRPDEIAFQLDASDADSGTRALTALVRARLTDGAGEAVVEGVRVRVLGFDAKGGLRYELTPAEPGRQALFGWVGSRIVIIGY